MTVRGGFVATLAALVVLAACAPAATTGGAGARLPDTRFSRTATLQLAQAAAAEGERAQVLYQQALDNSLQGIEAHPDNAQHYLLAGRAHAGLGNFEDAERMFNRTLELAPALADDIETAREQAWADAFNLGVAAYNAGDTDEALRQWQRANMVFDGRPEAYFNIAAIHSQRQEFDQAIAAFEASLAALDRPTTRQFTAEEEEERQDSRVSALQNLGQLQLFTEQFGAAERTYRRFVEIQPGNIAAQSSLAAALLRQGQEAEATAVYQRLMAQPDLTADDLVSIGVGLFQAERYADSETAFRRITEIAPNNRDGWYNYLQALYAQDRFADLIPVAERVIELDPLNETVQLIYGRAFRETRQQQRALQVFQRLEQFPAFVEELRLTHDDGRAVVRGVLRGNRAPAGTPINLEFTLYGPNGEIGRQAVTVNAPDQGQAVPFSVTVPSAAAPTGFRYRQQ
jgi:tetratricopeptide (TPR) repeat protein